MGQMGITAGKKDPFAERIKRMESVRSPFQYFDPVIESFADSIGKIIFPEIMDVAAPVPDHIDGRDDLRDIRIRVMGEPVSKKCPLQGIGRLLTEVVEFLQGIVGGIELREGREYFFQLFPGFRSAGQIFL